jgi:hypothetical protein
MCGFNFHFDQIGKEWCALIHSPVVVGANSARSDSPKLECGQLSFNDRDSSSNDARLDPSEGE